MFRPKSTTSTPYKLCQTKRPKPKPLASGQVNPFSWNDQLHPLKYHVATYGIDFSNELIINTDIENAIINRNIHDLKKILTKYKSCFSQLNIEAVTHFIYLQAICNNYSKEDFNRLLESFPLDLHTKIAYYVNIARFDEPPSEFVHPAEYTETLKELTIRFGAKALTAQIDDATEVEQAPIKKRRM